MNLSDAWTNSKQTAIQTSVMIASTRRPVTLMSPAAAHREIDLDGSEIVHATKVNSLMQKGYNEARRLRSSVIRLRLKQERGRPQERVLVITRPPVSSQNVRTRKARSRTEAVPPLPPPASEVIEPCQIIGPLSQTDAQDQKLVELAEKDSEKDRRISRLENALEAVQKQVEYLKERVEELTQTVERYRRHVREANGLPPTAPGLPSI